MRASKSLRRLWAAGVLVVLASCGGSNATTVATTGSAGSTTSLTGSTSVTNASVTNAPVTVASSTAGPCSGTHEGQAATYPPTLIVADRATGTLRWQLCPAHPSSGYRAMEIDGVVVYAWFDAIDVPSGMAGVAGFDGTTGAARWTAIVADPPLLWAGGLVLAGDAGDLVARDARTGAVRWRRAGGSVRSPSHENVTGAAAAVLIDTASGLVLVDPRSGADLWSPPADRFVVDLTDDVAVLTETSAGGAPAVTVAVDAATGRERWRAPAQFASAARGVVVLHAYGPDGARLEGRNLADGAVLWTLPGAEPWLGADKQAQGVPGDTILTRDAGILVGREAATGNERWRADGLYPAALDGRLLVGFGPNGQSVGIDAVTGEWRWALDLACLAGRSCTLSSGYVQSWALGPTSLVLAISDFEGT